MGFWYQLSCFFSREPQTKTPATQFGFSTGNSKQETKPLKQETLPSQEVEESEKVIHRSNEISQSTRNVIVRGKAVMSQFGGEIKASNISIQLQLAENKESLAGTLTDLEGNFWLETNFSAESLPQELLLQTNERDLIAKTISPTLPLKVETLPYEIDCLLTLSNAWNIQGRVLDLANQLPIEKVNVVEITDDGQLSSEQAQTDTQGLFFLKVEAKQQGRLRLHAPQYLSSEVLWNESDLSAGIVVLLGKQDQMPRIEGQVSDENGQPVANSVIRAWINQPYQSSNEAQAILAHWQFLRTSNRLPEAISDPNGRYFLVLPGLGDWVVWAQANGKISLKQFHVGTPKTITWNFKYGENPFFISGRITKKNNGAPVANLKLRLFGEITGFENEVTTDETGSFRSPPLHREPWNCSITSDLRFSPHQIQIPIPLDQKSEFSLLIELEEACQLSGRLINELGNPISGTSIRCVAGRWFFSTQSDEDGGFLLTGLPHNTSLELKAFLANSEWTLATKQFLFTFAGEKQHLGDIKVQ